MKILIGVQGTGNGHISRCHALAEAMANHADIEADFLVSGRHPSKLFDMDIFGDFAWRQGLSFFTRGGRVSIRDTLSQNPWRQFWHDVRQLDLSAYDLVVTDFEPVTAWAARQQGVRCVGMGRQYAFFHQTADLPTNVMQRAMMRQFAPCDIPLGMHWEDIGNHVVPPLIHGAKTAQGFEHGHYLVYLPFEPLAQIHQLLAPFDKYRFSIYHPHATPQVKGHCQYFLPSRDGFAESFAQAEGVITNAGFETSSEALSRGKKLLVKPLQGQFEQFANAQCLTERGLGSMMPQLDREHLRLWLQHATPVQAHWPDVAPVIVDWLADGARLPVATLNRMLWQDSAMDRDVA